MLPCLKTGYSFKTTWSELTHFREQNHVKTLMYLQVTHHRALPY